MRIEKEFTVSKGLGRAFGNMIRQSVMQLAEGWAPVAIHVGNDINEPTTILKSSADTTYDMLQTTQALISCRYNINADKDKLYKLEKRFTKKLTTHGLADSNIKVQGEDVPLVEMIKDEDCLITIYFMYRRGYASSRVNIDALENEGIETKNFNVLNSNHSNVDVVNSEVIENRKDDLVKITIDTNVDTDEDILQKTLDELSRYLAQ